MRLPIDIRIIRDVVLIMLVSCRDTLPSPYLTEELTQGTISETISATGEVSALVKVNVGSQVSGTIAKLHVDFNSVVKKGDILAELDPRLFVAQLQRNNAAVAVADAQVDKARVSLLDAERNLTRMHTLAQNKMVAQADLDSAEVAQAAAAALVKGAIASLQQAKADREQAAVNLAFTKIRSPIDGVVIDRQVDAGQTVAAQFQVATLFVIANDLQHVQVLTSVDEADVGKLQAKMPAQFRVDAYPDDVFRGTIREVRQSPIASSPSSSTNTQNTSSSTNVVTYAAVIEADNMERKLRQGMTAQVTVIVHQRANVVRIPNAALRFRPKMAADDPPVTEAAGVKDQSRLSRRVFRLVDNKPVQAVIRIGISDGRFTEVVDGLGQNDTVIIGESHNRLPGPRRGLF